MSEIDTAGLPADEAARLRALARPEIQVAARELARPARYYRYFNQGEHWVPNGRSPVRIADMDDAWRLNCARYLERNAARYAELFAQGCSAEIFAFGLVHLDAPDEIESAIWREAEFAKRDPVAWIKTTCLYRAMAAGLPSKGAPLRKLADRAKHWDGCEKRVKNKKGACTCAELARRARLEKAEQDRALAEATMPE